MINNKIQFRLEYKNDRSVFFITLILLRIKQPIWTALYEQSLSCEPFI
jgi:hypothetical protein